MQKILGHLRGVWAFLVAGLICISCTRQAEQKTNIIFRAPLGKSSTVQTVKGPRTWGVADPATMADIKCFVVLVSGPEADMSKFSCFDDESNVVMQVGQYAGAVAAGQEIQLSVPSGKQRDIRIIGFAATSAEACQDFTKTDPTLSSAPFILGSVDKDLEPGNLELDIDASMTDAVKFDHCDFSAPSSSGVTPTPTPIPTPFAGVPPFHLMLMATPPTSGTVVIPLDSIPHDAVTDVTLQVVDSQNRAVTQGDGILLNLTLGYPLLTFDGTSYTTTVTLDAQGQNTFQVHVGNNEMVTTIGVSYAGGISGVANNSTLTLPVGPFSGEPVHILAYTYMAPASAMIGDCVPIEYSIGDGPTGVLHPSAVNIAFRPTSPGGTFYATPDCTGSPAGTVTIPAGEVMAYLYFMPSSTGVLSLGFSGSPTNADSVTLIMYGSPSIYVP